MRLPGTAVFELSAIAQGITSAHIGFFTNSWDVSAGFLLIREAGGNITDHQGRNVDHYCREFVATNGIIHQEILECIGNIR